MKYVIFAVADEGCFTNIGEGYGRAIKIPNNNEINTFLDSVVNAKEITDEEYFELFPPVDTEEESEAENYEEDIEKEVR